MGRPIGMPKTGIFGLLDLVGLDLMPHVAASHGGVAAARRCLPRRCAASWPLLDQDDRRGLHRPQGQGRLLPPQQRRRRAGQGVDRPQDRRLRAVDDRATGIGRRRPRAGCKVLVAHQDKGGQYAWRVLSRLLAYAASLVPEIADDVVEVDEAMRRLQLEARPVRADRPARRRPGSPSGCARRRRPVPALLESAARRAASTRSRTAGCSYLGTDGAYHPVVARPRACCCSPTSSAPAKPIAKNGSAALWDIGDGVACLEFTAR